MPTNLNALIRYKTIDKCLGNRSVKCTIRRLREECSEALGEKRGVYKTVSERTIRDDIRVMRSDILGFNAPIAFEDGCYFYTEKDYSIFETYLKGRELLHTVYQTLLKQREAVEKSVINEVLFRLSQELGVELPSDIIKEHLAERISGMNENSTDEVSYSISECNLEMERLRITKKSGFTKRVHLDSIASKVEMNANEPRQTGLLKEISERDFEPSLIEYYFPWRFILNAIAADTSAKN